MPTFLHLVSIMTLLAMGILFVACDDRAIAVRSDSFLASFKTVTSRWYATLGARLPTVAEVDKSITAVTDMASSASVTFSTILAPLYEYRSSLTVCQSRVLSDARVVTLALSRFSSAVRTYMTTMSIRLTIRPVRLP